MQFLLNPVNMIILCNVMSTGTFHYKCVLFITYNTDNTYKNNSAYVVGVSSFGCACTSCVRCGHEYSGQFPRLWFFGQIHIV